MREIEKDILPYALIAILVVLFVLSHFRGKEYVVEHERTDTVTIHRVDTVFLEYPVPVERRVVDTVYVYTGGDSIVDLPIEQKTYSGKQYEAWVSGYQPSLDSIRVFDNVITNEIIHTVDKKIFYNKSEVFIGAGLDLIGGNISPNIRAYYKTRNGVLFGIGAGINKSDVYYGINVNLKIK